MICKAFNFLFQLEQLDAYIRELKSILYGIDGSEPVPEACQQVTQEFFSDDTLRLLITCLPKLNFEVSSICLTSSALYREVNPILNVQFS